MNPLSLRDYQVEDLTFTIMNRRCLLLHDPGGGKTPTVCVMIQYVWDHEDQGATVWCMPKQLFGKNRAEILRFTDLKDEDIVTVVKEYDLLKPGKVYIMTPQRLRMSVEFICSMKLGMVMGDEIHLFWATSTSKQTEALYQVMRNKNLRWIGMTGTIINGRLSSVYPSIHIVEPRYYPSYQSFLAHHAATDVFGNILYWRDGARIAEIISRIAIRRSFESIYGPESKVIVTEQCDMAPDQRKAYDEFESKAILELEDKFLEGGSGGMMALRCRQIMACPQTHGLCLKEATGKDQLLDLHLENHKNSGKPLVIFGAFQAEQERILAQVRAKGLTCALLNGNVSGPNRVKIDEDFRAGRIQVLVGSPLVASVGYNWDHCDHVIFTTLDYQDSTFVQGYRRMIRGHRSLALLITVLEYTNSLDQRVMSIIQRKSELAATVNEDKEVFSLAGG